MGVGGVALSGFEYGEGCPAREPAAWQFRGIEWSTPVLAGEYLVVGERYRFITSAQSRVVCLDARTGQPEWIDTVPRAGCGLPVVDGRTVVLGTGLGGVYAVDLVSGHRQWTYEGVPADAETTGTFGRPVVTDDHVVASIPLPDAGGEDSPRSRVVALDRRDGSERWTATVTGDTFVGPVWTGSAVVLGTESGEVHALDPESGDRRWSLTLDGNVWVPPRAGPGGAVLATSAGTVAAVDEGGVAWERDVGTGARAFVTAGERFVFGDDVGTLAVVSAAGDVAWQRDVGDEVAANAPDGDHAWVLDQTGTLSRVALADGTVTDTWLVAAEGHGDRCGWRPDTTNGAGLAVGDRDAYLTTRTRVRRLDDLTASRQ